MNKHEFTQRVKKELCDAVKIYPFAHVNMFEWNAKLNKLSGKVTLVGTSPLYDRYIVVKLGAQAEGTITDFCFSKKPGHQLAGRLLQTYDENPVRFELVNAYATCQVKLPIFGFHKASSTEYAKMDEDQRNMVEAVRTAAQRAIFPKAEPA